MADLQLSDNFHLSEFITSDTAARLNRTIDVVEGDDIWTALKAQCVHILEPIYAEFGSKRITSGFRPLWLNRLVGSADNSQHVMGEATDFSCPGHKNLDVALWIAEFNVPFDQVILEGTWVHVSYSLQHPPRGSILTARFHPGEKTEYLTGIVP